MVVPAQVYYLFIVSSYECYCFAEIIRLQYSYNMSKIRTQGVHEIKQTKVELKKMLHRILSKGSPQKAPQKHRLISNFVFFLLSLGRRVCLGEGLARMELFISLSNLLHQFTFKKPEETTILSFKATEALTRAPLFEYETRVILRD